MLLSPVSFHAGALDDEWTGTTLPLSAMVVLVAGTAFAFFVRRRSAATRLASNVPFVGFR